MQKTNPKIEDQLITIIHTINCYIPLYKLWFFLLLQTLAINGDAVFDYDFRDVSEARIGLSVIYCDFTLIMYMCTNYTLQMALTFEAENH